MRACGRSYLVLIIYGTVGIGDREFFRKAHLHKSRTHRGEDSPGIDAHRTLIRSAPPTTFSRTREKGTSHVCPGLNL